MFVGNVDLGVPAKFRPVAKCPSYVWEKQQQQQQQSLTPVYAWNMPPVIEASIFSLREEHLCDGVIVLHAISDPGFLTIRCAPIGQSCDSSDHSQTAEGAV